MVKAIYRISIAALFLCMFFSQGAFAQLAPGVQQSAAQTATLMGTVIQNDGTPVAGADIRLIGPALLSTKSDAHGIFDFTGVPYGVYRIVVLADNLEVASRDNITVKGDSNVTVQYAPQRTGELKTIARVSTHSSGANINVTSASIASVSPSAYAFQGNSSWQQLLNQIPGVVVGGNLFHGNGNSVIPGGPFTPIVISINGALPYETSTMLDGMPLQNNAINSTDGPGSGTDLSFLPLPTFDTADVVRGPGADAPSIVDSIGGSFVLHAPGNVDKNQYELSLSNDPYGGVVANAKATIRFGQLSATIVYGVNDSPGPLGKTGLITGQYPPITVDGQPFVACTNASGCGGYPSNLGSSIYQNCYCELQTSLFYCCVPNSTAWTQHNGSLGLAYKVTPSITAQVFYAGSSSDMQLPAYAIPFDFIPGASYAGSIAAGQYSLVLPIPLTPITQSSSLLEEKITAYMGRGVLRLAALQDNSFSNQSPAAEEPNGQYSLYGTACQGTALPSAACPSGGTLTTYNGTAASLTFFPVTSYLHYWENSRDFLANYETQLGSKSSLGVSYVTSYYNDPYEIYLNLPSFSFSCSIVQPPSVSETTREVRLYGSTAFSDNVTLNASWYFSRASYHVPDPTTYIPGSLPTSWSNSDFSYNAPRLGIVWRANRDISIRAAAGGGYALPPIAHLVGTSGFPTCSGGICTVSLTNLNLQPEKSFGFDLGTDMRFHRDTVVSLDLYRTNLYGQFFQSVNITGTFLGFPLYTNQYENLSKSRFEGINVNIRHDVPKGIYWHGALGLTRGYVVDVPAGFYNKSTCVNCNNLYVIPGINFNGRFQSPIPYANGSMQIGYRWSPDTYVDLSPTYYGTNNPYFMPAFLELDADASHALTKDLSVHAIFRNITGIYGQNYQSLAPSMGAPTIAGQPYPLFGIPYGPRSVIVTVDLK